MVGAATNTLKTMYRTVYCQKEHAIVWPPHLDKRYRRGPAIHLHSAVVLCKEQRPCEHMLPLIAHNIIHAE